MAGLTFAAVSFNDAISADGASLERIRNVESVPGSAYWLLGYEDDRDGILAEVAVPRVSYQANDPIYLIGLPTRFSLPESLADRIALGEKVPGKLFVNNRHTAGKPACQLSLKSRPASIGICIV